MKENEYPKLRNGLEALPIEHSGQRMLMLRDRIGYAKSPLLFSPQILSLLAKMNGGSTLRDLQAEFMRTTGQLLYLEELQNLVSTLDEHLFLDNDRFRKMEAAETASFVNSPVRKPYHAGRSYPEDSEALRALLQSFFSPDQGGPGVPAPGAGAGKRLLGLVAPHIDLNAGGSCFAHAYKAASEAEPPRTWIILGTGHDLVRNCFALTVKDFETPLGTVHCNKEICEQLLARTPANIRASEYNHRTEHTIEFQAVFLAFMQPQASIVPILCSFGHEEWESCKNIVNDFAHTLSDLVFNGNHSVGLLASVDLAHVGPRYGDAFTPHPGTVRENLESDASLLGLLEECRSDEFFFRINRDGNSRKICGAAPLYTMARALEGHVRGQTLSHSHAVVDQENSFVTFASMAFYEEI